MKLFIANITKQIHDFHYVLPENKKIFVQPIASGSQIMLTVSDLEAQAVIDQHAKYNMVSVKDIKERTKFVGLTYQIGKAIDVELLQSGFTHNEMVLIREAQQRQEEIAGVIDHNVNSQAQELGVKVNETTFEVVEQPKKDQFDKSEKVHQKVTIKRGQ
jgi:hypothetical protein